MISKVESKFGCVRFHQSSFSAFSRQVGNRGCMSGDGTISALAFAASEMTGERYIEVVMDNSNGKLPAEYGVVAMLLVQQSLLHALYVSAGKQIFQFSRSLVRDFLRTDLTETPIGRLRLPYAAGFLHFGLQKHLELDNIWRASPEYVDGAYYHVGPDGQLTVQLTLSREEDASSGLPGPHFSLDKGALGGSAHEAVDRALDRMCEGDIQESESTKGMVSEYRDWEGVARPAIHQSLSLVLNALFYLDAYGANTEPRASESAPTHLQQQFEHALASKKPKKVREAVRALEESGFTVVRMCGASEPDSDSDEKHGTKEGSVRAHWRRGHWRMQPHGPQLSLVKRTWIRPTLVGRNHSAPVAGHQYVVGDDSAT